MNAVSSKELISSRSNKTVRYLKSLSLARNRQKENRFIVEGVRIVEEAMGRPDCVESLCVTPHAAADDRVRNLVESAVERGISVAWFADRVVDYISDTKTSQGVLALVRPSEFTEDDLEKGQVPVVLLAHLLQDPGNIGTIIRVAEAAGAGGVVTTPGTVDLYNPKALRASMGSIFRLPALRAASVEGFVDDFRSRGFQMVAAMVSARTNYFELDLTKPTVLMLGQEATGLPKEVASLSDHQITIPMTTMMDSLNVASAASIIIYEAVRQKLVSGGELTRDW
jgi:RNA methyltransferase, TrmH family